MRLDRVTITGPDDSISVQDLLPLTREFPFVEWGILASASHGGAGSSRFPSHEWIASLRRVEGMNLSLHLCGRWVRSLLLGDVVVPTEIIEGAAFKRVQLNFHAERTPCNADQFFNALLSLGPRQYIFQIDGANGNRHLESIYERNDEHTVDAVPLFDVSGGAGILPAAWPEPEYMETDVDHVYHGYAGGLGPDNLEQQLPLIAKAAGKARIWIDMETRVRSADDRQFDLGKVRRCLEICAPHIGVTV